MKILLNRSIVILLCLVLSACSYTNRVKLNDGTKAADTVLILL